MFKAGSTDPQTDQQCRYIIETIVKIVHNQDVIVNSILYKQAHNHLAKRDPQVMAASGMLDLRGSNPLQNNKRRVATILQGMTKKVNNLTRTETETPKEWYKTSYYEWQ